MQNEIKLNIIDVDGNSFDLIVNKWKVHALLERWNHKDLREEDLINKKVVLITLYPQFKE